MIIRQENTNDYNAIFKVVKASFKNAQHTDGDEHNLVERLRKSDAYIPELALVAEIEGKIAGYIMFTKNYVDKQEILVLAPLAVHPDYQNQGIGSRLIIEGHRIAKQLGYKAINLLGHEGYYPRFGYVEANIYGTLAPFEVPSKNFMIYIFDERVKTSLAGTLVYHQCFFNKSADGFYDKEEKVIEYETLADGYDGKALIEILKGYIPEGSKVLELGMGPGKDLLMLNEYYNVTGSDQSEIFVNRFNKKHPSIKSILLDAVTLDTDEKFDCIYTNKVLQHLSVEEIKRSVDNQADRLRTGGYVFHSLWYGQGEESYDGLLFNYYDEVALEKLFSKDFELIRVETYTEMEAEDSIFIIAKKKG